MSFGGASLGTAEGRITVDTSQAVSSLGQLGSMMSGFDSKAGMVGSTMGTFKQSTVGLAQGMQNLGRVGVAAGAAVAAPFVLGVNAAMDFESAMAGVNAVMDLQGDQYNQLSGLAKQLGADTIFTGEQAAQGIETLGRAGISFEDIMSGAAAGAADLAAAGGIDVPRAAEVMAAAMQAFNIEGEDSVRVADALAGMANQTLTDVNQLGIGLGQVAGVAAAAGMSLEETTAFIGLLADNGIRGSDAATSMKNAILSLLSPTDKAQGLMDNMGVSVLDASGNFIGLAGASKSFFDAWKNSGQTMEQFLNPLNDILGRDAVRTILFGMQAYEDQLNGLDTGWQNYVDAASEAGAAEEFAAKRMDSTAGAIERLKGSLGVLQENMGAGLNAAIRGPIEGLVGLVNIVAQIPGPIFTAVSAFGALLGSAIALGGAFLLVGGYVLEATARFGAAGISLGAFTPIALAVVAALAAIGIALAAYEGNWFGFADGVNAAADALAKFLGITDDPSYDDIGNRDQAKQSGRDWNSLEQSILDVADVLDGSAIPALDDLGDFLNTNVAEGLFQGRKEMEAWVKKGANPLVAGIKGITKGLDVFFGLGMDDHGLINFFNQLDDAVLAFGASWHHLDLGGENPIVKLLSSLGVGAAELGLTGLSEGLINAANMVRELGDRVDVLLGQGFSPLAAILGAVAGELGDLGMEGLSDQFVKAANATIAFGNRFRDVRAQLEGAGFDGLSASVGAFGEALQAATGIDITGFTNKLAGAINAADDAFFRATREGATPFAAALRGVDAALDTFLDSEAQARLDGLSRAFLDIKNAAGELVGSGLDRISQMFNEIGTALSQGDFSGVGTAIQSLATDVKTGVDQIIADLQTIDVPAITISIGQWLIEQGEDLLGKIKTALGFGDANGGGSFRGSPSVVDIPSMTARIGTWLIEQGEDLFEKIKTFFGFGGSGDPNGGGSFRGGAGPVIDIPSITATIGGWLIDAKESIADAITAFVTGNGQTGGRGQGAIGNLGGVSEGVTLDSVKLNIGSWVKGKIEGFEGVIDEVKTFIGDQLNAAGITIENFSGWAIELGAPSGVGGGRGQGVLGTLGGSASLDIEQIIRDSLNALDTTIEDFTGYSIELGNPMDGVTLADADGAIDALLKPLRDLFESESFTEGAKQLGEDAGTRAGEALGSAINDALVAVMSGGGGRGGGQGVLGTSAVSGGAFGSFNLETAMAGFAEAFIAAFKAAAGKELQQAKDELGPWLGHEIQSTIEGILTAPIIPSSTAGVNPVDRFTEWIDTALEDTPLKDGIGPLLGNAIDANQNKQQAQDAVQSGIVDPATQGVNEGFEPLPQALASSALTTLGNLKGVGDAIVGALFPPSGGGVTADPAVAGEAGDELARSIVDPYNEAATEGIQSGLGLGIGTGILAAEDTITSEVVEGINRTGEGALIAAGEEGIGVARDIATNLDNSMGQGVLGTNFTALPDAVSTTTAGAIDQGIGDISGAADASGAGANIGQSVDQTIGQGVLGTTMTQTQDSVGLKVGEAVEQGTSQIGSQGADAAQGAAASGGSIGAALDQVMSSSIAGVTLAAFSQAIGVKINEAIMTGVSGSANTMGGPGERGEAGTASAGIGSQIGTTLATSIQGADFTMVGTAIQTKISEALSAGMSTEAAPAGGGAAGGGAGIGASVAMALASQITGADFSSVGAAISQKISEAVSLGMAGGGNTMGGPGERTGAGGGSGIGTAIAASIATEIQGADFGAIGEAIATNIGAALASTAQVNGAMGSLVNAAIQAGVQAATAASQIGEAIGTAAGSAAASTQQLVGAVTSMVTAAVQAGVPAAAGATAIGAAIGTNAASAAASDAQLSGAVGSMVSAAVDAGTSAASAASAIGQAIGTAAGSAAASDAQLSGAVGSMVSAAIDAGVQAAAGASAIGAAISSGAASGVIVTALNGVVAEMVANGIQAGMDAAGAASPSKKMMQLGEWMSEGLAIGVQNKAPEAESAGSKLANSVMDSIKGIKADTSGLDNLASAFEKVGGGGPEIASQMSGIADSIKSGASDAGGSLREMIKSFNAKMKEMADSAKSAGKEIGDSLGSGLGDGIKSAGTSAVGAAENMGKQIRDKIRSALENLPSIGKDQKVQAKDILGNLKGMKTGLSDLENMASAFDKVLGGGPEIAAQLRSIGSSIEDERSSAVDSTKSLLVDMQKIMNEQKKGIRQIIKDLGKELSQDIGSSMGEASTAADAGAAELGSSTEASLNANLDRLPEMAEAMGTDIGTGLSEGMAEGIPAATGAGSQLGDAVGTGLTSSKPAIETAATDVAGTALDSTTTALGEGADAAQTFSQQIGELIAQAFGTGVGEGGDPQQAIGLVNDFGAGIREAVNGLIGSVQTSGTQMGNAFNTGVDTVNARPSGQGLVSELGAGVSQGLGGAEGSALGAGQAVGDSLESGVQSACGPVNDAGADLTESCIPGGINSGLKDATNTASDAGKDVSDSLLDGLNLKKRDVENQFGNVGKGFTSSMAKGIGQQVGDAVNSAKGVATQAGNVDGKSQGVGVGESFGSGIAAGIENYIPEIIAAAKHAVQKAEEAAKDEGKSKSPSKVFMAIGRDLSLGMAIGMENELGAIIAASQALVSTTNDMVSTVADTRSMREFNRGLDRYTSSFEDTIAGIDEILVKNGSLPITEAASSPGLVTTSSDTRESASQVINIDGVSLVQGTPEYNAARDFVTTLMRTTAGQYTKTRQ